MKRFVLGCGSQARYVIDNTRSTGRLVDGLIDLEGGDAVDREINGVKVVSTLDRFWLDLSDVGIEILVAHGDLDIKERCLEEADRLGIPYFQAIHTEALVSPFATVGAGAIINAGATIMANAVIGDHVVIHSQVNVDHDCRIERAANLAPGVMLAGRVRVGAGARLYTGCCVAPDVHIGEKAIVGAGSVVLNNVPAGAVVAGNPARRIR